MANPAKTHASEAVATRKFAARQQVWVDGRPAIFCYDDVRPGAAVVRYQDERGTRVVPLRKITNEPPRGSLRTAAPRDDAATGLPD